ncbi:MAG: hypothetical protein FWB97_04205 [Oscillospiraceae bacterium]|nr:hypothetical protein [Oscillospiraceae bacterium]
MQNIDSNLREIANTGRLSHAYVASPSLASALAMAAVCSAASGTKPCMACAHCGKALRGTHPDITIVSKIDGKREIVVDQIRELKKNAIVIPNDADRKAYIVLEADTINSSAQNAFLQLLEEPPAHAVFILSTDAPAALLKTVRSRCVELKASPAQGEIDESASTMVGEFFAALESGNASIASFMFKLEKLDKTAMAGFIELSKIRTAAEQRSVGSEGFKTTAKTLSRTERILEKAGEMLDLNVGSGHISGMICASLLEIEN